MSNTTVGGVPGHMAEIVVVWDNILKFLNARLAHVVVLVVSCKTQGLQFKPDTCTT